MCEEANQSTPMVATSYLQIKNSYDESMTNNNSDLAKVTLSRTTRGDEQRRTSTLSETLLGSLVRGSKANCLLTSLLCITLVASCFNTLLLSFVIRSIQLNNVSILIDPNVVDRSSVYVWTDRPDLIYCWPLFRYGHSRQGCWVKSKKARALLYAQTLPAQLLSIYLPIYSAWRLSSWLPLVPVG